MNWRRRTRILTGLECVGVAIFLLSMATAWADVPDAGSDEICGLVPGLQGRIGDVHSDPGIEASVSVERGGQSRVVSTGCYLRQGDIVRAGRGTTASVILPSHQVATASFDAPVTVPATPSSAHLTPILGVLRAIAGDDGAKARDAAMAKIAATRGLREPPYLPGLVSAVEQRVSTGNALFLHWEGGSPPFAIRLRAQGSGGDPALNLSGVATRIARLDTQRLAAGRYDLTIADRNQTVLMIHLQLVPDSDVPVSPDAAAADDDESKALLNAVWLFMRGAEEWQLEALSRLEYLAVERDDVVADGVVAGN